MNLRFPQTMASSAEPGKMADGLWPDAEAGDAFADAALRIVTRLFDLPLAVMHISGGDFGWYEHCVTGSQFGSAFWQTVLGSFPSRPLPGERPLVVNDDGGIWQVPAGTLPAAEQWIRFCIRIPLASPDGAAIGYLWLFDTRPRTDIGLQENALLADMAMLIVARFHALNAFLYRDRLTRLGNRSQFIRDVEICVRARRRDALGGEIHAVVVDAGSLPVISRMVVALGLTTVENAILAMNARLAAALPAELKLYRIGFACFGFLHCGRIDAVRRLALLATTCFDQPLILSDHLPVTMAVHAGIVRVDDIHAAKEVISALFAVSEQARTIGKAWLMYDRGIASSQQRTFSIVNSMQAALRSTDQLRLVYQPRERLNDGAWVAAEALLRWRHPQLGEIAPSEVLPLIEATSLMPRLTDWVIEEAVRQLAIWNRIAPGFTVSINVSSSDFSRPEFVDGLSAALIRHRAKGSTMEIEITETAIAGDPEHARRMLERLKQIGIRVVIDDFGVGHSSLSRWQTFSFDMVKIDRALIHDAVDNDRAAAIFQWVVSLAKKLGQKVVAEGIETAMQRWTAVRWGCDEIQGFFVSRPLEASFLTERLTAGDHRSIDNLPIGRTAHRGHGHWLSRRGETDFVSAIGNRLHSLRDAISDYLRTR